MNRTKVNKKVYKKKQRKNPNVVRLNKFLSESGVCSRRKADRLIEQGHVKVNGKVVKRLGTQVKRSDKVVVKGAPVKEYTRPIYIMLNKPKNVISTTKDEKGRTTVIDLIKVKRKIFSVGRLDRNTTGALILTNDGALANRLMHPSYKVERTYLVKLDRKLEFDDAQKIADGIELEDGKTSPCNVIINPEDRTKASVTLFEGRNKEIHRLFTALGYTVKQLDRKFYAGISVSGLKQGEYRFLKNREINKIRKIVGLN